MSSSRVASIRDGLWQVIKGDPQWAAFARANNLSELEDKKHGLFGDLMDEHGRRITLYNYYHSLYYNAQWYALSSDESPFPTAVNYAFLIAQKHAGFLMNKGFLVESDFPEIERFLQYTYKKNNLGIRDHNNFGLELALQGGITGDSFMSFDRAFDNVGNKYFRFNQIKSNHSFPIFSDDKMEGFLDYGLRRKPISRNHGFAKYQDIYEGVYYNNGSKEFISDESVINTVATLSYDLPIIHFKNLPTIFNYGLSDLASTDKLTMNWNEMLNETNKIVKYFASPITIITGAKAEGLTKGTNRVWSIINPNAKVTNLQLDGDLAALVKHMENLREAIADLSSIPDSTLGKINHMSNTSGSAIAVTFMPLFEVMEMKRITYGTKFLELNSKIIREAIIYGELDVNKIIRNAIDRHKELIADKTDDEADRLYPFRKKVVLSKNYNSLEAIYKNEIPEEIFESFITWFPPLPRDEKSLADMATSNTGSYLWSRRHARSVMGMSEKESMLMEKEIVVEQKVLSKTITNSNKIKDLKGDPDIVSENNSINHSNE